MKWNFTAVIILPHMSLPLRGAWIEIVCGVPLVDLVNVAPLAGGVD